MCFASRALSSTEIHYAQIEKEMLAIVFACDKFNDYIFGRSNVFVQSDHKLLEIIFKKDMNDIPKRLQRMRLRLQKYKLNVRYTKDNDMYIADTLSRAFLQDDQVIDGDMNVSLVM